MGNVIEALPSIIQKMRDARHGRRLDLFGADSAELRRRINTYLGADGAEPEPGSEPTPPPQLQTAPPFEVSPDLADMIPPVTGQSGFFTRQDEKDVARQGEG